MQKFQDVVLDSQGRPVAGAVIAVLSYPGGSPATVYQTDAVGTAYSPTTDDYGAFYFYAPDGRYSYTVTVAGVLRRTVTDLEIVDTVDLVDAVDAFPAYEVGTWTPTLVGETVVGSGTYVQRVGTYTKNGNIVHCTITLQWSAHTGSGSMIVTGLPYPVKNLSNLYISFSIPGSTIPNYSSLPVFVEMAQGSASLFITNTHAAVGPGSGAPMASTGNVTASFSYPTD